MKDESAGEPIIEFVCLRPKMYSILKREGVIKKAKRVKKSVVKKNVQENYKKKTLFKQTVFRHGMNTLRSMKHQLYGLHFNKHSLSPLDTKRWIKEDGINTLAFGHNETQS